MFLGPRKFARLEGQRQDGLGPRLPQCWRRGACRQDGHGLHGRFLLGTANPLAGSRACARSSVDPLFPPTSDARLSPIPCLCVITMMCSYQNSGIFGCSRSRRSAAFRACRAATLACTMLSSNAPPRHRNRLCSRTNARSRPFVKEGRRRSFGDFQATARRARPRRSWRPCPETPRRRRPSRSATLVQRSISSAKANSASTACSAMRSGESFASRASAKALAARARSTATCRR